MGKRSSGVRVPILAAVAVVWATVVDLPNRLSAGSFSVAAVATLATTCILLALTPSLILVRAQRAVDGSPRMAPTSLETGTSFGHHWVPLPLSLFAVWAVFGLIAHPTVDATQNVCVYLLFILSIAMMGANTRSLTAIYVFRWFILGSYVACGFFLIQYAAGFEWMGPRSFALVALVFLAVAIPYRGTNILARTAPYVIITAVTLSLSRTATAIAFLLLSFMVVRGRRNFRLVKALAFLGSTITALWLLVTRYGPVRDRFLTGDSALTLGDVKLNTSGRSVIWQLVIDSANKSPLLGHGPGTAAELVSSHFATISHPHNDYLRLYHDFGAFGLFLFLFGYLMLIRVTFLRARRDEGDVHWSALIALLAVAAAAFTDNTLVYPFVMLPLGVLVGLSVGSSPKTAQQPEGSRPAGSSNLAGHAEHRRILQDELQIRD